MAHETANRLKVARDAGDQAAFNMALEGFLIHARNIRDFFGRNANDNDVLARDFLGRFVVVRLPYLRRKSTRVRLNRRVAHLSYSRARLKNDWPVKDMLIEIHGAMTQFERELRAADARLADTLMGAVREGTSIGTRLDGPERWYGPADRGGPHLGRSALW